METEASQLLSQIGLLLGGSGGGAAGLLGLQKLGILKNGNGNSKEITKITVTLESMVKTLEPLAGILSAMKTELGVISEKQTAVSQIPVMKEKIHNIQEALKRIENDVEAFRPRARSIRQDQG